MEVAECGAACLAMVLAYHGHHAPLPEVRVACGVSRDGANALAVVRAARQYGMEAKGAKLPGLAGLAELQLPAILPWDFNHFVVLERISAKRAWIVDPASGRRSLGLDEVGRRFTGVALILARGPEFRPRGSRRPSLSRYRTLVANHSANLWQILLASIGLQFVGLAFPVANQILLDRVISPHQEPWLWGLAFGLGGAVLAKLLLTLVRSWVVQGLQNRLDSSLMTQFLHHLVHLPISFFLQREAGDLVQRVQSNATLRNFFSSQSIGAILDVFLLLGYAGLMIAFEWHLGLIVIGFGAIRVSVMAVLKDRNQQVMASELAALGRESGALVEALSGLETTKASAAEGRMIQRWAHRMVIRLNKGVERRLLAINAGQLMVIIQGFATASVFFIGGNAVIANTMTIGVFSSFLALQQLFMGPLESLLEAVNQLQFLGNHLRRLDDVLETAVEPSGTRDPGRIRGEIELKNVGFRYAPSSPPTLQGVSTRIRAGEKVAIVGPSGSGKSTLARLLLGMHLPEEGSIHLDGTNLLDLDLEKVRQQMGVVLQETFLFDDTVRANLCLHDEEMSWAQMRRAARMACIDEVIESLPEGYSTRIGENGSLLSGGQRQRLSLARALAHQPSILLLDEATSALDLETEAALHAHLAEMGCTRIVIAHRMATVVDADRILVLESGRIVQEGSYASLRRQPGLFCQLAESVA